MGKARRQQSSNANAPKRASERTSTPKDAVNGGLSFRKMAVIFSLLAALNYAGMLYYWRGDGVRSAGDTVACAVAGNVSTLRLKSPRVRFAERCAADGVPVVLTNSVVTRWKAQKWTPKYLQSKMGATLSGVYENDNRWFGPYYDAHKPLTTFSTRVNSYSTNLKLTTKEFFRRIRNPHANRYLYFTGDIEQLGAWSLSDIEPLDELLALNPQRSSINVWMGQPRVIAHCHYDGYHNFYAQLFGRKKFTLIRPSNWPGLYPYPFLHPSHAQAQVNLSDFESASGDYPLVERVEAFEAYLEPGDLLYVPPLWFHHVESLDVSISVNVWTDSQQTELMERAFAIPLPINEMHFPNEHTKAIATSHLLHTLLEQVCQYKDCAKTTTDKFSTPTDKHWNEAQYFLHRLWAVRYKTLLDKRQLRIPQHLGEGSYPILCELGDHSKMEEATREARMLTQKATSRFEEYTAAVAELVRELPADTWELWLGNYVEFVVANAVDVEHVGLFLEHCSSCWRYLQTG